MAGISFLNFDLLIERAGNDFQARVLKSPAGDGQTRLFSPPFTDQELAQLYTKFGRKVPGALRATAPAVDIARAFGKRLYDSVFDGDLKICFQSSRGIAQGTGVGLRIRLRLNDVPALADMPWELLHDADDFILLSSQCSLVRYLEVNRPAVPPLPVTLPLRALAMFASPSDLAELDIAGEVERLDEAVAESQNPGLVDLQTLPHASLDGLRKELGRATYPILHFGGHGEFTPAGQGQPAKASLMLETANGTEQSIDAIELARQLQDYQPLRLVVLNACQGAQGDTLDVFAGLAQTLIRQGVPAVIAMQFPIFDDAAKLFAGTFYDELANGLTIDEALGKTRQAMSGSGATVEWATPVLFTRADDGNLLNVAALNQADRNRLNIERLVELARASLRRDGFEQAEKFAARILDADAAHPIGAALRLRAQQGSELASKYENAQQLFDNGQYAEALPLLEQVVWKQVNYRDTAVLLEKARQAVSAPPGAVVTTALLVRPTDRYESQYKEIAKYLLKGRVVPFFGSGVNRYGRSMQDAWQRETSPPTADDLAAYLADSFEYDGSDKSDLIRVSQYVTFTKSAAALYEEVRNLFEKHYEPTPLHRFWADVPARLRAGGILRAWDEPVSSGEIMT